MEGYACVYLIAEWNELDLKRLMTGTGGSRPSHTLYFSNISLILSQLITFNGGGYLLSLRKVENSEPSSSPLNRFKT